MEKFLLRAVFAGNELDIIDHQHIDRTELILEIHRILETERPDKPIHEFFSRQIQHTFLRAIGGNGVTDGMHQMGLAETDTAIDV